MPIYDYARSAALAEANLLSKKDISSKNKGYIKKFLENYIDLHEGVDVRPARRAIFCKHIYHLLKHTPDIKKDMKDKTKIDNIFSMLRTELSINYYATVVNVSKRLVRQLNNGELPKGFKDIKGVSRKKTKRNLKKEDMITWPEGLKLANATTSIQIKAAILTQLDAGLRPSEFIDLNYGDCDVKKDFIVVSVHATKTDSDREVILFRSVPYLQRWLRNHPTKKKSDPLWIMEQEWKSHRR